MYSTYILGEGGSGNIVDRQPQKFALRGDSKGVWGGGVRGCMASYGLYGLPCHCPYPIITSPVPFTPLPQKNFSLQPFVQEYKIYTVLQIWDVYPRSRILIFTHPGSRILYPGSRIQQQQYRGMKKNLMSYLFM
jgi:hypothetical protein